MSENKHINDDGTIRVWVWYNEQEDGTKFIPKCPSICIVHSPTPAKYNNKQFFDVAEHPMGKEIVAIANFAGRDPSCAETCSVDFTIPEEWWDERKAQSLDKVLNS